jgi:hypothetical protein
MRTLALLGVIFVWCCFPILTLINTYNSKNGQIVAMPGQVNIWIALAASAVGSYIASLFVHNKFCVHDLVFSAFTVIYWLFRELLHIHHQLTLTTILELHLQLVVLLDLCAVFAKLNSKVI